MDFIEIVLSTELLTAIAVAGAFAISLRSLLQYSRKSAELRPKIDEAERALKHWRTSTEEQRKTIQELSQKLPPIQAKEAQFRLYFESLQHLWVEHEKKERAAVNQMDEERRKRIHRKKMGFDEL
jgi:chromosome segregation ATPase